MLYFLFFHLIKPEMFFVPAAVVTVLRIFYCHSNGASQQPDSTHGCASVLHYISPLISSNTGYTYVLLRSNINNIKP